MKTGRIISKIILSILFFSCGQTDEKKTSVSNKKDTTDTVKETVVQTELEARRQIEERNRIDSLILETNLTQAIEIAQKFIGKNKFEKEYTAMTYDSSYSVDVYLNSDFYFTKDYPHLIIRRIEPSSIHIDIFSKINNQFKKVLSHEQSNLEYTNDTIQDINGDGLKDLVWNWYGNSGCCLKAFTDVFLLRPDKKSFSQSFQFINPTFSPKEKIIRGICYGHPGNTEMYKYKWNKETVDTLEYVSYEKDDQGEKTGTIIISKERFEDNSILKRLKTIPKEYKNIMGYTWFTGEGYE